MEKEKGGTGPAAEAPSSRERELIAGLVVRQPNEIAVPDINRRLDDMRQGNWQFTREVVRRVLRRHAAQARTDGDASK